MNRLYVFMTDKISNEGAKGKSTQQRSMSSAPSRAKCNHLSPARACLSYHLVLLSPALFRSSFLSEVAGVLPEIQPVRWFFPAIDPPIYLDGR